MHKKIHDKAPGIIVLAAGKGTRMNSDIPKVLHLIHGKTMISCVLECAASITDEKNIVVVVGHQSEKVKEEVKKKFKVLFALQKNLSGTGDAVKSGLPFLMHTIENIIILCGDVPLIKPETLIKLADYHEMNMNDLTVLAVELSDPSGYGRLILDSDGSLLCIREESDATHEEKQINIINSGVYCVRRKFLSQSLDLISRNNAQKEYYLTDIVFVAKEKGAKAGYIVADDPAEFKGVNTLQELKNLEKLIPGLDL